MKKYLMFALLVLVAFFTVGCNDKEEAKEEPKDKQKQAAQQKPRQTAEREEPVTFNHSASLKMRSILQDIPGVVDPFVLIRGEEALIAYLPGESVSQELVRERVKQQLSQEMPEYRLHIKTDKEAYQRLSHLYQDSIESEGKTIKNLGGTFDEWKKDDLGK